MLDFQIMAIANAGTKSGRWDNTAGGFVPPIRFLVIFGTPRRSTTAEAMGILYHDIQNELEQKT